LVWLLGDNDAYDALEVIDPSILQDNVFVPDFFDTDQEYRTSIVDGNALKPNCARDSQVAELSSYMNADYAPGVGYYDYVAHGPAIYSDEFTVPAGRQGSLDWAALTGQPPTTQTTSTSSATCSTPTPASRPTKSKPSWPRPA
jgi:hypothetical protein